MDLNHTYSKGKPDTCSCLWASQIYCSAARPAVMWPRWCTGIGREGCFVQACWDLCPNGEGLIAGKSSYWQAASQCMLKPAATASHPLPTLDTYCTRTHMHTHKIKSESTARALMVWLGWWVGSHFIRSTSKLLEAGEQQRSRAITTNARCLDETAGGLEDFHSSFT